MKKTKDIEDIQKEKITKTKRTVKEKTPKSKNVEVDIISEKTKKIKEKDTNEIKIENDEINNTMIITLKKFEGQIVTQKDCYNFLVNSTKSNILSSYLNLKICCKKKYLLIKRLYKCFSIESNQDFEFNYSMTKLK